MNVFFLHPPPYRLSRLQVSLRSYIQSLVYQAKMGLQGKVTLQVHCRIGTRIQATCSGLFLCTEDEEASLAIWETRGIWGVSGPLAMIFLR
jgi:hypothetical protein